VEARERKVAVAVVSYNTRKLLLRCLDSLAPESDSGRAAVWVIDNHSSDGSLEAARAHAPWARVIDAGANLGYGRAVNEVAHRTHSEWLLIANADVALEPGSLEALLAAGSDDRVGCAAPRLVLPSGVTQHSVHRLSPRIGDRLCLEGHWDPERPRDVPWAIGACLLLRREAFDEVGEFDEQQWMYAEDLDLQWCLHRRGWRTRYVPEARVLHESGAAAGAAFGDRRADRFMAASYALLLRRRGAARTWATAAINIAGAAARVDRAWLRAHLEGVRSLDSRRAAR
jgi:GT2 family glycosyltransferase